MGTRSHEVRRTPGWVPNHATDRIMSRVRMEEFLTGIDWEAAIRRFEPLPEIPAYVRSSIHGIEGGYSTPFPAGTWDAVVKEIFAEYFGDESSYRDALAALPAGSPQRILDVACGTGESTLAFRRRFPRAEIVAVDVSPFMLVAAERKLEGTATLRCANAESLPFEDASFDLVTASLLFHELPRDVAPIVLGEMRRVASPGGEIAILEPYRAGGRALKPIPFPEPYLKDYLATDWDAALSLAGFNAVRVVENSDGWMRTARAA